MRYTILAFGKPSLPYVQTGIDEYRTRLKRFAKIEEVFLKEGKNPLDNPHAHYRIALDERGSALTTQQWAAHIKELEIRSTSHICFIIGAADGHSDALRKSVNKVWQLAPMTLNHELALLVLWEQIYRVHTLLAGHPYHRE